MSKYHLNGYKKIRESKTFIKLLSNNEIRLFTSNGN